MNKRLIISEQRYRIGVSLNKKRIITFFGLSLITLVLLLLTRAVKGSSLANQAFPDQVGTQWSPFLEWSVENPSFTGNPYDVVATVTFVHGESGESRTTEMFYNGSNVWKFRFSGTRTGQWTFTTSSDDPELNGRSGTVIIQPNPGSPGFVTHIGNKWARSGTGEAFVPQYVMVSGPHNYYNNPGRIDSEIQTFIAQHGFNGFHTPVYCRWLNMEQPKCGPNSATDPDPRTFEALESLITRVYNAGGIVHIWVWSDNSNGGNPHSLPGGINGEVDRRLQRYIAARLGPIPGWTMGYGFDLWEWTNGNQLTTWHDYMQAHLGWTHYLGARSQKNQLSQLSEAMEYSGYEQHKPTYNTYVQTIETRPHKPSLSEDRFRIRDQGKAKDYTMEETRRGLWHSTLAGGVANIWGNLLGALDANEGFTTSAPYPNPEWIKTYAEFFKKRFLADMVRCNELTNGFCLKRPMNAHFVFYKEDTASIEMNLSTMAGAQAAIAVDTRKPYAEINLGTLEAANQTWNAPYPSDWAIAVGAFPGTGTTNPPPTPLPTNTPEPTPLPTDPPPTATAIPTNTPEPTPLPTDLPPTVTAMPTNTPPPTSAPPGPTPPASPTPAPLPTETPAPGVCSSSSILFIGRSTPLSAAEQALVDYLGALGHIVIVSDQRTARTDDAAGKDLVIIAPDARRVGNQFRDVAVPVIVMEVRLFSIMSLTGQRDGFGYLDGQSQVAVIGNPHPLAAGLSGTVITHNGSNRFYWGHPGAEAVRVAVSADPNKVLIFAYEIGASLASAKAPARRVAFYNGNGTGYTADGWLLFRAAAEWSLGCS